MKLNKCSACGAQALLVRRGGRLDYRCANRNCYERPRTEIFLDTSLDLTLARAQWNSLNPATNGVRWPEVLDGLCGQTMSAIVRYEFFTTTLTGRLESVEKNLFRVFVPGASIEFSSSAVHAIEDRRIVIKEKPRHGGRGLVG
jgi:hypothetical protein